MKNKKNIGISTDSALENAIDSLRASIARLTDLRDQSKSAIPGVSLHRIDEPTKPANILFEPRICIIAQGAKRVLLGEETHT
ncbi:MAG: AraC family transcriptional regulator, partial [Spirochaetia bacterium]|nr:AraC family transcriptional regulator [Spirochaetia bacterium]